MCKFKDTTLGIKKLDFNVKRGAMAAYLTDGREIIVPVSMFPDIKHLTKKQREEWMIMDDQYFSFEALSRIYSVKDLLRLQNLLCNSENERFVCTTEADKNQGVGECDHFLRPPDFSFQRDIQTFFSKQYGLTSLNPGGGPPV